MKQAIDNPQVFAQKLRPLLPELFRTAHAITGNMELAEYVLRRALREAYLRRDEWRERMSFRDGLAYTVRHVAMVELKAIRGVGRYENDWRTGEPTGTLEPAERAIFDRLRREPMRVCRAMVLSYGCAFKPSQVAQVLQISPGEARALLTRLKSRVGRSMRGRDLDDQLERLAHRLLEYEDEDLPDSGVVLRAFERDAQGKEHARPRFRHAIARSLVVLGAILCALLFWLMAILLEPGNLSAPMENTAVYETAAPDAQGAFQTQKCARNPNNIIV